MAGTRVRTARIAEEPLLTDAGAVVTDTVVAAVERAGAVETVDASPSREAHTERPLVTPVRRVRQGRHVVHERIEALAVLTKAAVVLAALLGTGRAAVQRVADTGAVVT